MKKAIFTFIIFFILTSFSYAHRINVFCWAEGKKVKCESSFTPGGPVKGAEMLVFCEKTKKLLLKGKTNDKGQFEFNLPEEVRKNRWKLKIVCNAEMGHKNFWILTPEDYLEESDSGEVAENESGSLKEETQKSSSVSLSLNEEKIKGLISKVLQRELNPIKRELARMNEKKITLDDIISGIGYILGFVGIVFYFKARNKKNA